MASPRWAIAAAILMTAVPTQAQSPDVPPQWTLPLAGFLNGSKAEIENKPCCGPSGGAPVEMSDARVLATVPGAASRQSGVLRLKLAGDRTFKLTDCIEQPACDGEKLHVHRLAAWWPQHRTYVVAVGLYEASVAYLISERDGRALVVAAPPVLSPSGRTAVALVSDLMNGVELEVIDLGREPPTVAKVTVMPTCPGFSDSSMLRPKPVWIDDTHVRFEGVSPQPGDNPNTKQLLRIAGGKVAWEC
jgi:hypothetical protein